MEQHLLRYKTSDIAWYRYGSGPKTAVCFHGYGEDGTSFSFLSKYAGHEYTFFAIDLPFHGKTDWRDGSVFGEKDLQEIIEMIIGAKEPGKLTLVGYSLGGRIALSYYQSAPATIEKLVLFAPDGLKLNGWYWLATQTWLGNRFFAFTMKKPAWFFFQLKIMNKLKLVNTSIFKFVNYYIGDAEVRRLLYTRWTTLRRFRPHIKTIKQLVREYNTPVRLLYGQHDRIILSSVGKKFITGIEAQSTLLELASGHQVLHEKHIKEILPALLH